MSDGIVIVGGGLAGQRCAETLRRIGCEEPILMVCGEPYLPYDRPPLSKDLLLRTDLDETLAYRSGAWYDAKSVKLLLGVAARGLDHREKLVHLSDGSSVSYSYLLIATGARARALPMFTGYDNVSTLRTREDARELRAALVPNARLLVIGAGFVGQEVVSVAQGAGVQATIVEAGPAPLASVLGIELGGWFAERHRSNGVELFLEDEVVALEGERRVNSVTLAGGRTVPCDHVLLAVGVEPNLNWLNAGAPATAGVRTDVDGRTCLPGVYAAGDAAAAFDPLLERHVLGNHWENAGRQGIRAAKAMLGMDPGPRAASSFWSDLYGTRIQYLGHASLADGLSFDGDPHSSDFTATFTKDDQAVAVLLAGRPQMLPQARELLTDTTERTFA